MSTAFYGPPGSLDSDGYHLKFRICSSFTPGKSPEQLQKRGGGFSSGCMWLKGVWWWLTYRRAAHGARADREGGEATGNRGRERGGHDATEANPDDHDCLRLFVFFCDKRESTQPPNPGHQKEVSRVRGQQNMLNQVVLQV